METGMDADAFLWVLGAIGFGILVALLMFGGRQ